MGDTWEFRETARAPQQGGSPGEDEERSDEDAPGLPPRWGVAG
ncbi:hypothetical protein Pla86_01600 [Planctomycetes bacterium Pla86]|uniref:Uncharacterized protein n=1 Tax=Engelhardtia mirabilis TaxID=2528011 RepID=A0A518BDM9_9BACT|nr:hypothetical protein Pla133_01600 [Planctomycetes bacterium Pla133]QDU99423.1 hypothetical protein Pla86_01600 [Planctomycetes bacterium Pla86]